MYRLYVDEVGNDALTHLDKDKHRFLSLTGIAMKISDARDSLEPRLNRLKADLFNHDPDSPLVLHRKDIVGGKGVYGPIRTDRSFEMKFNEAILQTFRDEQYSVITALIDKDWMVRQAHWKRKHPYHYLMEILVEKYVQFLERKNTIGDIMPESREGKDALLQKAYEEIRLTGCSFVSGERIGARLRGPKLKFRRKVDNIAGLQLCDLLAHPSHIYVRSAMGHDVTPGPFCKKVCDLLLSQKYDRSGYGKIKGYGYKHLPDAQRAANAAPMD